MGGWMPNHAFSLVFPMEDHIPLKQHPPGIITHYVLGKVAYPAPAESEKRTATGAKSHWATTDSRDQADTWLCILNTLMQKPRQSTFMNRMNIHEGEGESTSQLQLEERRIERADHVHLLQLEGSGDWRSGATWFVYSVRDWLSGDPRWSGNTGENRFGAAKDVITCSPGS